MRVSILSVKGGIGKSTLALLLGKFFAENGKESLIIDRDPLGWASKVVGIDGKGLVAQIVDSEKLSNYYKEVQFKSKLGVVKLYGDGPRFYTDAEIISSNPSLKEKLEREYGKILLKGFDFYLVDNPSMITWNDLEVKLELSIFKKFLPNEKIARIYLTDNSESTINSTKNYIQNIEGYSHGEGSFLGLVVNLVPPFPEDIEKAREKVKDIQGIKVVIPFIEELFMFNKPIEDLVIPEEVKELGEYILKLGK